MLDPRGMGMAPCIGGRGIVADEADDFLAACPGSPGGRPLLEEGLLRRDLPFEAALRPDQSAPLAPQSLHFRHSRSPSPFKTPD